jgi:hypothetical protein
VHNINLVAWHCTQTIPTEQPLFVGEVSANFCGQMVPHGQRDGSFDHILNFVDCSRYFSF